MSSTVPESTLTSDELLQLSLFDRELADALDEAIGEGGDIGGSTVYEDVKNALYGAVGDGVTDDTLAVTAAVTAAATSGRPIYFPPGTYLLTNQGGAIPKCVSLLASTAGARLIGDKATIKFDSSVSHCFRVNVGCTKLSIEGLNFIGYTGAGYDDFAINAYDAVYVFAGVVDVSIERCEFKSCQGVFFAADDASGNASQRLYFNNNVLIDSPVSVSGGPSHAKITNNWFKNGVPTLTQSHAIYVYGNAEHVTITGNTFLNHGDAPIEIRASSSTRQQKRCWIINDNEFVNNPQYSMFLSTQASETNLGTCTIVGNVFKNTGGVFCIGIRDTVITSNVFEWDYEFAAANATGVTIIANIGGAAECIPQGNIIAHNRFTNRHPFWAKLHVASQPADGDQVVIGNQTYTWRTTPTVSGEVASSSNIDTCVLNLAHEIQGRGLTPCNVLLRDLTDVWYTASSLLEGDLWIASYKTFTFTRTGTAVTVTAVTDNTHSVLYGINISLTIETVVQGNLMTGCTLSASHNVSPFIKDNVINPGPEGVGLVGIGNAFPIYDNNQTLFDRSLPTVQLLAADYMNIYDAFPVLRDNNQPVDLNLYAEIPVLPWLQGVAGWTPVGDGKAHTYMFYGSEQGTLADPAGRSFQWADGDQISLYNADTDVEYIFSFKRSAPNGTTEFNSYATLLALINDHTDGSWDASNPIDDYTTPGTDTQGYGYIHIVAGAVGTARNADSIRIVQNGTSRRGSRTCGVYLRPWAENGLYPGGLNTPFCGGAATATCTVVYTPLASKNTPLIVQGVDATSQALAPIAYQADVIPGVCYVITHTVAAGTEKFFYKVA